MTWISWQTSWTINKFRLTINEINPLVIGFLIPLILTSAASAAGKGIHEKIIGPVTKIFITLNEKLEDMKMAKSFVESGLLIKSAIEKIGDKAKKEKGGFLSMFLGANLLGNLLSESD